MNTIFQAFLTFADAAPAAQQGAPAGGGLGSLWIFLPILGIMYFLIIVSFF